MMTHELPQDADGDALRRLIATGSDLSRPMTIDFAMSVPNEETGSRFASVARNLGYLIDLDQDEESGEWTCYCSKEMVATHEALLGAQRELTAAGAPFGAAADGWGSFGNGP